MPALAEMVMPPPIDVLEEVAVEVSGVPERMPPTTMEPPADLPPPPVVRFTALGLTGITLATGAARRVVVPGAAAVPENTSIDLPTPAVRLMAESSRVKLAALVSSELSA